MKKILSIILALILCMNISAAVFASQNDAALSSTTAKEGDIVYLSVTLNKPVKGSSVAVVYSYNDEHLEALPEQCSWEIQGILSDFDNDGAGVWMSSKPGEIDGVLCLLAFRVREGKQFSETEVVCELMIQNDGEMVVSKEMSATVTIACDHVYEENWTSAGEISHERACALCGKKQTQTHAWDDGIIKVDKEKQYKMYTCQVCAYQKTIEIEDTNFQPESNAPGNSGTQHPESNAPGNSGQQQPENNYPNGSGQQWGNDYPNGSGQQTGNGNHTYSPDQIQNPQLGNNQGGTTDNNANQQNSNHTWGRDDSISRPSGSSTAVQDEQSEVHTEEAVDEHAGHNHAADVDAEQEGSLVIPTIIVVVILVVVIVAYFRKKK